MKTGLSGKSSMVEKTLDDPITQLADAMINERGGGTNDRPIQSIQVSDRPAANGLVSATVLGPPEAVGSGRPSHATRLSPSPT